MNSKVRQTLNEINRLLNEIDEKINLTKELDEERYPMTYDQLAQIDCRKNWCKFNNKGACNNISPAITLNATGGFICWSETNDFHFTDEERKQIAEEIKKAEKDYQQLKYIMTDPEEPDLDIPHFEYSFMGYCLDGWQVDKDGNLYWDEGADE